MKKNEQNPRTRPVLSCPPPPAPFRASPCPPAGAGAREASHTHVAMLTLRQLLAAALCVASCRGFEHECAPDPRSSVWPCWLALPLGAVAVGRWDTVQSQMFGWLGRDYLEGQLEWYAKNYRVIVIGSVRAWLPPPPPPAA